MIAYNPVRLDELIEHYMARRTSKASPISVYAATKAILTVMPDCALENRKLADLIAACAVRHGHVVSFDMTT